MAKEAIIVTELSTIKFGNNEKGTFKRRHHPPNLPTCKNKRPKNIFFATRKPQHTKAAARMIQGF